MGNGRRKNAAYAEFKKNAAEAAANEKELTMERFFLARIQEREVEAQEKLAEGGPSYASDDYGNGRVGVPAEEVLAECMAHRKILEGALLFSSKGVKEFDEETQLFMRGIAEGYVRSLRYLVSVHRNHADFNDAWIGVE